MVFPWHAGVFPRLLLEENEAHQRCGKMGGSHEEQTHRLWLRGEVTAKGRDGDGTQQGEGTTVWDHLMQSKYP